MKQFQQKRPAGFIDLMVAFESRKRGKLLHLGYLLNFNRNILNIFLYFQDVAQIKSRR